MRKLIRTVQVENGGIRIGEHWFTWNYFFEVNEIIEDGAADEGQGSDKGIKES